MPSLVKSIPCDSRSSRVYHDLRGLQECHLARSVGLVVGDGVAVGGGGLVGDGAGQGAADLAGQSLEGNYVMRKRQVLFVCLP